MHVPSGKFRRAPDDPQRSDSYSTASSSVLRPSAIPAGVALPRSSAGVTPEPATAARRPNGRCGRWAEPLRSRIVTFLPARPRSLSYDREVRGLCDHDGHRTDCGGSTEAELEPPISPPRMDERFGRYRSSVRSQDIAVAGSVLSFDVSGRIENIDDGSESERMRRCNRPRDVSR